MRGLMGFGIVAATVAIPVFHITGLINSVAVVNDLSLIALQLACFSGWASFRVEVRQVEAECEQPGRT